MTKKRTTVYTDGGYYYERGTSGAAWMVDRNTWRATLGNAPSGELAELEAIVLGVEENAGDLVVHTDCQMHARGPAATLVTWLKGREFADNPVGHDLTARLERAIQGRVVNITRGVSKGPRAAHQLVCCDMLERYTRQCHILRGVVLDLGPETLVVPPLPNLLSAFTHALEVLPVPASEAGEAIKAM